MRPLPKKKSKQLRLTKWPVFQALFPRKSVDEFWLVFTNRVIGVKALKKMLPFASSWLCKDGFSALTDIKVKKQERFLQIDEEMRVRLTMTELLFDLICTQKQAHLLH